MNPFMISIHSLRVEGDRPTDQHRHIAKIFQSTPSVWRETSVDDFDVVIYPFQSTPSVWRETRYFSCRMDLRW